jgi:hypothetical protein
MTRSFSILSVFSLNHLIFFLSLVLGVILVIGSTGCRMCGTQYDYCTPAYTGRTEDYRGCDPLYRAGSIFNCDGEEITDADGQIIRATNAGNFGTTTPVGRGQYKPSRLEPRAPIGRPPLAPTPNGNTEEPENTIPGIEDLIRETLPTLPPALPTVNPPVTRQIPARQTHTATSSETIPFSAQSGEPTFTIEDLRRLDPSVTDIKILNVEDNSP